MGGKRTTQGMRRCRLDDACRKRYFFHVTLLLAAAIIVLRKIKRQNQRNIIY
jgi:hypothetical protein